MNAKTETIAHADAHLNNVGLPTYSELLAIVRRLAYPDSGELLTLDGYRNIARNVVQPDGVRVV